MPDDRLDSSPAPEEGKEEIRYASPLKRIWAWVGVAYMAIIVLLITYLYANAAYLTGIGGLMTAPALAGAGASVIYLWRAGEDKGPGRTALMVALVAACAVLLVLGLIQGIPALVANFRG